jgi:hypothetical protein
MPFSESSKDQLGDHSRWPDSFRSEDEKVIEKSCNQLFIPLAELSRASAGF